MGVEPLALINPLPLACRSKIRRELGYPLNYAQEVLKVCIADRWNNTPCWLVLLLQLLQDEPETAVILNRISVPPVLPDPLQARVLVSKTPFVNRAALRSRAASLQQPRTARPVLVINGPEKSGKSYTADYVEHLYLSGADFRWVRVALSTGSGITYGAEKLARDILIKMGIRASHLSPTFFERDTNNVRWPIDLAGSVLNEGLQLDKSVWIILDNFRGAEVAPETLAFIDGLAQQIIGSSDMMETYRLVLIDFDRALLSIQEPKISREQIAPISKSDVLDCVHEIVTHAGKQYSREEVEAIADQIVAGLPAGARYMEELNRRLSDLLAGLEGGTDA